MKNCLKKNMRLIMSKQDKYELNDIVILNDNLEYSIIKKVLF